jgi:signal transduction histidine kinase
VRTRITRAILLVTGMLVLALGIPLAIGVQRFYENRAVVDLQRRAAEATAEISIPLDPRDLAFAAAEPDAPGPFSVYDADGDRLFGDGPPRADATVREALRGDPATEHGSDDLVVATPISQRQGEGTVGAMRVSQASSVVAGEARRAWARILVAVAIGFAAANAVAQAQARRLAAPIDLLAQRAQALGEGDFTTRVPPCGVPELDQVGQALDDSGRRLAELLARERAFSADVSHQLRTPLAGLRLELEHASEEERPQRLIDKALTQVDRLTATVEHLLALSRDSHPVAGALLVSRVAEAAVERWQSPFAAAGRTLEVTVDPELPEVRGTEVSIGQVLDVLLDNALVHGEGRADLRFRPAVGGLVIEVGDEGPGIDPDRAEGIFERGTGDGTGIGLGLARTIVEADGGRLLLASTTPPRFHVVLAATLGANPPRTFR